ncbi:MAG: HAD family phosphatase [Planctomycetaceae bacterium]|nr:HAD family phosphatase [Planctomycetaceae bacterium]
MLKAVIFDFDGVIADSEELHYKALNEVLKRYGVDVPKAVHWQKYLGYTDQENIEAVSRDYGMGLDAAGVQSIMQEKKRLFNDLAMREAVIIDGVEDFVRRVRAAGIRMAICSGALRSDIELMLDGAGFAEMFEVIVSAEDVQKGKPEPEGYLLALERLNRQGESLQANECAVIEDSRWGLEAAAAAGMCPVAVTTTYSKQELQDKARKVVSRLEELKIETLADLCKSSNS